MKKQPSTTTRPAGKEDVRVGQLIDVTITTLNEDGFGLATTGTKPLLVSGVLPGEQAQVRITFVGRRECFATVVRILRHAPQRLMSSPCEKLGHCDGCPLMFMKYPAQLAWKRDLVEKTLTRYRSLQELTLHDVLPSPRPLHYRNSAKLVISGKSASPVIGIYRRNSHEVLEIGDCPLHNPLINTIVAAVREGIKKGKVPIYSPRNGRGLLRYLVIRVAETENRAMVVFVTAERSFNEIHHLAKHLQSVVPQVAVVAQNVNASAGNIILGDRDHFITRERTLHASIGETRFTISPRSFFQVNSGSAEIIYRKVREWANLTGREFVVDLYCGIGGISLFLAPSAKKVLGIEVVEAAVADAELNARLNGIGNCTFEAGDAGGLLTELRQKQERVDLLVLNPPRKGCDEQVLQEAAALAPDRMIYVSCSPSTLARDLDILVGLGYRTVQVQPVDMFPQTPHVENMALLLKA
ncbi:23S rRNA (uracil(1939)-C(5))-methyltransferase RlmD [Geobacter sp. AOG1]|uniref:23S rRNA (uracil(1939)-C(5))-methyltransferase RlmD n=1 Tax=Geobacter sp. AOG1 TaxID=1566346 RepID=UPI001E095C4F|nr:23S rRNA (uracil(1939)-C(5))-methyltransferase RlmD [Geobacter sp. AOG1]GFE58687.1 putative RNA methyltransferase [Geobacter sp. AOG1]